MAILYIYKDYFKALSNILGIILANKVDVISIQGFVLTSIKYTLKSSSII